VSLLAEIDSLATEANRPRTWFDRLPDEAQQDLLAIRKRFQAGEYGVTRTQLARLISRAAKERGWKVREKTGMVEWLGKKLA